MNDCEKKTVRESVAGELEDALKTNLVRDWARKADILTALELHKMNTYLARIADVLERGYRNMKYS